MIQRILAIHHLVDLIHSAEIPTDLLLAHVLQIILDLHQTVDLNASAIPNVHQTVHVSTKNVEIHVLDHAATMLAVKLSITFQFVLVLMNTLAIHSQVAIQNLLHVRL